MKREKIIEKIKAIIEEKDSFSVCDVDGGESPVISCIGKHSVCAERFNSETVTLTEYIDGMEINESEVPYEDLKTGVLKDILKLAEEFEPEEF
jgi:hypothetical protein